MISVNEFYSAFGIDGEIPDGDFIVIDEQVRVMAKQNEVTMIFDSVQGTAQDLRRLFEVSRTIGEVLPFTTKSGKLAMKILCEDQTLQTTAVIQQVDLSMTLMLAN